MTKLDMKAMNSGENTGVSDAHKRSKQSNVKRILVDSELLVSFFTGDPENRAQKAKNLISKADDGKVVLEILPMVLFKLIYDLEQLYHRSSDDIHKTLVPFLRSKGIQVRDDEVIFKALQRYHDQTRRFEKLCLQAYAEVGAMSVAREVT